MLNHLSAESHPPGRRALHCVLLLSPGECADLDVWSKLCGKLKRVLIDSG